MLQYFRTRTHNKNMNDLHRPTSQYYRPSPQYICTHTSTLSQSQHKIWKFGKSFVIFQNLLICNPIPYPTPWCSMKGALPHIWYATMLILQLSCGVYSLLAPSTWNLFLTHSELSHKWKPHQSWDVYLSMICLWDERSVYQVWLSACCMTQCMTVPADDDGKLGCAKDQVIAFVWCAPLISPQTLIMLTAWGISLTWAIAVLPYISFSTLRYEYSLLLTRDVS